MQFPDAELDVVDELDTRYSLLEKLIQINPKVPGLLLIDALLLGDYNVLHEASISIINNIKLLNDVIPL